MVVHVVEGRASAEIELAGPAPDLSLTIGGPEATELTIRLGQGEPTFTGTLLEVETRWPPDGAPTTVLRAEGQAADGGNASPVALRLGAEIVSGSVRRHAGGSTAHCIATGVALARGKAVDLVTQDPELDGRYEIVELWHRFDLVHGLRVDFVAVT